MVNPYPNLPSIYVPGEKQESSKPEKTGKPGTGESQVYSWATPQITRGTATKYGIQKIKKVSETCDVVFLNRMYFKTPKIKENKKQVTNDTDLNSVQKDERRGTITADFVAGNHDASMVESMDSSVPDTPMVNSNPGRFKYRLAYRRTMHYDPVTGRTIGAEATAVAHYYQCLKDTDGKMEFANVGAGIGGGFENTIEPSQ